MNPSKAKYNMIKKNVQINPVIKKNCILRFKNVTFVAIYLFLLFSQRVVERMLNI